MVFEKTNEKLCEGWFPIDKETSLNILDINE